MNRIVRELVDFLRKHQDAILTQCVDEITVNPTISEIAHRYSREDALKIAREETWPRFLEHLETGDPAYHDWLLRWTQRGFMEHIPYEQISEGQLAFQRSMVDWLVRHYQGDRETLSEMILLLQREIHDHVIRMNEYYAVCEREARQRSEARYREIVENATDMIYLMDTEGRFTFYNRAAAEALGYDEQEMIGHHFSEVLSEESLPEAIDHFQQAMKNAEQVSNYRVQVRARDGRQFPAELHIRTLTSGGKPEGRLGIARDVTLRAQFERELERQRDWFHQLLQALPDTVVVYDGDYRIVFSNNPVLEVGKACHECIRGLSIPCPQAGVEHPCAVRDVIHKGIPEIEFHLDYPQQRLRIKAAPIVNPDGRRGAIEIILDETSEREIERMERELHAERQARRSRELLHNVLQAASDGICIMKPDGTIRYSNEAIRQILDLPRVLWQDPELFPHHSPEDAHPILCSDIERIQTEVLRQGSWQAELDVLDGERVVQTYLVSATLIPRGRPEESDILWYAKDITLQRQLRQEIQRAERLAAVAELASLISHEIRNPLAAIQSASEMLRSNANLSSDDRELLRIVQEESKRVNHILTTYLRYARMSAPQLGEVDLHAIIRNTVRLSRPSMPSGIQVETHFDTPTSRLKADAKQLHQVFLNLVQNAVEAMGEEGTLFIRTSAEGDTFLVEFEDTGPGLPEGEVARLFEPFYSNKPGGTGMGLAVAKRIIEGHGGNIEVGHGAKGGARFLIQLPA